MSKILSNPVIRRAWIGAAAVGLVLSAAERYQNQQVRLDENATACSQTGGTTFADMTTPAGEFTAVIKPNGNWAGATNLGVDNGRMKPVSGTVVREHFPKSLFGKYAITVTTPSTGDTQYYKPNMQDAVKYCSLALNLNPQP